MDHETTLQDLKTAVKNFIADRNWKSFHNPKNVAMSIAIEAPEIMEHFQWISIPEGCEKMQDPEFKAEVADELADAMIYCLSFAIATGIDVSEAIKKKLDRNELRFPVKDTDA